MLLAAFLPQNVIHTVEYFCGVLMALEAYSRLASFYDSDWGDWCFQHLTLIRELLTRNCPSPARILDLACGTGKLVEKLTDLGHCVDGLDISAEMISVARSRCIPGASFSVQNMTSFSVERPYHLITCTFDALNYLQDISQVRSCLERVAAALCDRGIFLFDMNTEELYTWYHRGCLSRSINGVDFLQDRFYDKESKVATTIFRFPDGSEEKHVQRAYNLHEIRAIITESGLEILEALGSFTGEQYGASSERCICVVQKRENRNSI